MNDQEPFSYPREEGLTRSIMEGARDGRQAVAAPSLSKSNNCTEQGGEKRQETIWDKTLPEAERWEGFQKGVNRLTGQHERTAFALTYEVEQLGKEFGESFLGMLTLTFADNVLKVCESQRRFHSLLTHVIKVRYRRSIRVIERMASRRIHYHLVVVTNDDIKSGADLDAIAKGDYRSANKALRAEWAFWRKTAKKYGFGRTELLPVKSTIEGMARYVGKYIAKGVGTKVRSDKGARVVGYSGFGPGDRKCSPRFAWANANAREFRRKLAKLADFLGLKTMADLKAEFGPRWAYALYPTIMRIDEILARGPLKLPDRAVIPAKPLPKRSSLNEKIRAGEVGQKEFDKMQDDYDQTSLVWKSFGEKMQLDDWCVEFKKKTRRIAERSGLRSQFSDQRERSQYMGCPPLGLKAGGSEATYGDRENDVRACDGAGDVSTLANHTLKAKEQPVKIERKVMEINLSPSLVLTNERCESRYGIPVLVKRNDNSKAYGPADVLDFYQDTKLNLPPPCQAGHWVYRLAKSKLDKGELSEAEKGAVASFLGQWPEGPQL